WDCRPAGHRRWVTACVAAPVACPQDPSPEAVSEVAVAVAVATEPEAPRSRRPTGPPGYARGAGGCPRGASEDATDDVAATDAHRSSHAAVDATGAEPDGVGPAAVAPAKAVPAAAGAGAHDAAAAVPADACAVRDRRRVRSLLSCLPCDSGSARIQPGLQEFHRGSLVDHSPLLPSLHTTLREHTARTHRAQSFVGQSHRDR